MNKEYTLGCIGCGTMGSAVVKAISKKFTNEILVSAAHFDKVKAFADQCGDQVKACAKNSDVGKADIIFVAVKPVYVESVLSEINTHGKTIVSMAAGVTLAQLKSYAPGAEIIRIMPNIPCVYHEGMTGLCSTLPESSEKIMAVKELLSSTGKVEYVPEHLMNGVTAVSGSGPAYGFIFIEALADAAVKFGMPRAQAYIYAAQTLKGAATMALEDPRSISQLKDAVCSPAGTTIEGVIALEENGFRNAVIKGATAAFEKSVAMSKKE